MDATPAPDPRDRAIAYAAEVLRQHTPDRDGWCLGCLDLWGRLVFIDQCTQAQWVAAVHAHTSRGDATTRPPPRRTDERRAPCPCGAGDRTGVGKPVDT